MGKENDWSEFTDLAKRTWRGGTFAHYFFLSAQGRFNHSEWFSTKAAQLPHEFYLGYHNYFGVHPTLQAGTPTQRSTKATVAAVNCFFADFDAKDQVEPDEYAEYLPLNFDQLSAPDQKSAIKKAQESALIVDLETFKHRAWAKVHACPLLPSWAVDSGGGFQCYWFLTETIVIDNDNRERIAALQKEWLRLIDADPAAAHLAQLLRIPGSRNRKAYFKANFPEVFVTLRDDSRLYELTAFEELTGVDEVWMSAQNTKHEERQGKDPVFEKYNSMVRIGDLLVPAGYQLGRQYPGLERYARPGREKGQTSVVVWTETNRSYHHSSNDLLFTNGHSRDAFDVFTALHHNGDATAAYIDAKKQLGLWEDSLVEAEEGAEEGSVGGSNGKKNRRRNTDSTSARKVGL